MKWSLQHIQNIKKVLKNLLVMPPHFLTNFDIQKYYENESKFNGVYLGNNLSKIKDGAYIINLD